MKKDELRPFAIIWMELKATIPNEIAKEWENKHMYSLLNWN